ncbi:MAG: hypothetical protein COA74_14730 [Gammaproteobacteria bacterium]|nr:MAG: hypothetical protein COA74_14730 [Gammaproteobacteria bacterium]
MSPINNIDGIDVAVTIFVVLLIFLIIRELITWYFKINERTKLLHNIDKNLTKLLTEYRDNNLELVEEVGED